MRILTETDLADSGNWMDARERRERLFGWTDRQVCALWFALGKELEERGVSVQLSLSELADGAA